jgi:hypothetical protein
VNDFRCNNRKEAWFFLQRFLNLKEVDLTTWKPFLSLFQGRSRIITDFIVHISSEENGDLQKIISEWRTRIVQSFEDRSLYSLIDKFVKRNTDQWERKLADVLYAYYIENGRMLVDREKTDFMAAGFCFFKGVEAGKNIFYIAEPLVVESLRYYMETKEKSIVRAMMIGTFQSSNSSQEKGRYLDTLIPLSLLLEQKGKVTLEKLKFHG